MTNYLIVAQILVAIALIVIVTLQVHGGGLGGIFGQAESVYRTRRALAFQTGRVMKATRGRATPATAKEILLHKLGGK